MRHSVDAELLGICQEIKGEGKTESEWAEIEASDWFQTPRYCGGFDATDMHFAFTVFVERKQFCFALGLEKALLIADQKLDEIDIEPSPWDGAE